MFYLNVLSKRFPNGFDGIVEAKIEEVETVETVLSRQPKIDEIEGFYFTRRDLAEVALKWRRDRNLDRAGIYLPESQIPASYAAGRRLALHRAKFEALKNQ